MNIPFTVTQADYCVVTAFFNFFGRDTSFFGIPAVVTAVGYEHNTSTHLLYNYTTPPAL